MWKIRMNVLPAKKQNVYFSPFLFSRTLSFAFLAAKGTTKARKKRSRTQRTQRTQLVFGDNHNLANKPSLDGDLPQ
jgi:hypothetical protein